MWIVRGVQADKKGLSALSFFFVDLRFFDQLILDGTGAFTLGAGAMRNAVRERILGDADRFVTMLDLFAELNKSN